MQNLLTSGEKISNILQVAGSTIEVGAKIYCARIDDTHNEILKLANALNKVHIRENDESFSGNKSIDSENDSDNETKQKQKTRKKKAKKVLHGENRVTIYPCDTPLNAVVNQLRNNVQDYKKTDLLDTGRYEKPGLTFELLTTTEAKCLKWSIIGSEIPPECTMMRNILFKKPLSPKKICKKLSNFQWDLWNVDDDTDLNSTRMVSLNYFIKL